MGEWRGKWNGKWRRRRRKVVMVECIGGEWMEGMNGKEINEVKESRGRKVDEGKSEERWMVGKWVLEEEEEAI